MGVVLAIAGLMPQADVLLGAGEAPLLPLASQSASSAAIAEALMALRRGNAAALEALPQGDFTAPIAFPDERRAGIQRRWTALIPAALQGLGEESRRQALAILDRLYRRAVGGTADAAVRARLAVDYLPAAAAVAALTAAADRAFDRGEFQDFLNLIRLLDDAGQPPAMAAKRGEVALLLSGRGPQVDAGMRLPPPGDPQPSAAQPGDDLPRLAVSWLSIPGWILACDPWGGISWQYAVDRSAIVVLGAGAALVQDSHGLRALDDQGTITRLGPLPGGARVWAVAVGAAWFTTGMRAWRLVLATSQVQLLELGAEALSAPLVRGAESLWLTERDLLLFDGDHLLARMRHGLSARPGWRLVSDRSHPLIIAADGRSWRLEALDEQLAHAGPLDKAQILIQAGRWAEAVVALAGTPEAATAAGRRVALRAHLGLGAAHALTEMAALLALAQDAQEQVLVRQAAYLGAVQRSPRDAGLERTLQAAVAQLAQDHQEILFSPCTLCPQAPGAGTPFTDPPAEWPVALTGAGYLAAAADDAACISHPGPLRIEASAQPLPAAIGTASDERQADGSTRYRQFLLRLVAHVERKELRCYRSDGTLLWWHRWAGLPVLVAPSTSVFCRSGTVIVSEGQSQVRIFDIFTGVQLAQADLDDRLASLADAAVVGRGGVALLGPVGVDTRLVLTGAQGMVIDLPAPGRWLMGWGDHVLVALHDGRMLSYPGGAALAVEEVIARSVIAPLPLAHGLIIGSALYPWSRQ